MFMGAPEKEVGNHGDVILDLGFWVLARAAIFFVWVRVGNLPAKLPFNAVIRSVKQHTFSLSPAGNGGNLCIHADFGVYTGCGTYTQVLLV